MTNVLSNLDQPSHGFISSVPQMVSGWLSSSNSFEDLTAEVDGKSIDLEIIDRPDVNLIHLDRNNIGWNLWINPTFHHGNDNSTRRRILSFRNNNKIVAQHALIVSRKLTEEAAAFPPILWMHIPKTGGSSILSGVDKQFGRDKILRIYEASSGIAVSCLPSLPLSYIDDLEVVFGHFAFGIHNLIDVTPQYVTVMRDPIEMMKSYIAFIDELKEDDVFLDNPLTRYISGSLDVKAGAIDRSHMTRAKEHISKYFIHVGQQSELQITADWLAEMVMRSPERVLLENRGVRQKLRILPSFVDVTYDLDLFNWYRLTDPLARKEFVPFSKLGEENWVAPCRSEGRDTGRVLGQ